MEQTPTLHRPFKEILAEVDRSLAEDEGEAGPQAVEAPASAPTTRPITDILTERGTTHGDYTDHATITQMLKRVMRTGKNWESLSDIQKETLEMNAHKVGRILSGNPNHKDHWDDIAGYAVLVSERI